MKAEYLAYPPQIAEDVEIIERREGARMKFIVGSAAAIAMCSPSLPVRTSFGPCPSGPISNLHAGGGRA